MINPEDLKILNFCSDHVRYIDIAIREMAKCTSAWIGNDREEMNKSYQKLKQAELDADKIKLKLMIRVSEDQASLHRTDFLRLILQMDTIADFSEGVAARIIRIKITPDKSLAEKIIPLSEATLKMGDALKRTIKSLLDNPSKTSIYCDEIDKFEEAIDGVYRDLEAYLYESDIDVKIMLQISSAMHQIEDTADLCQRSADNIRIIAATM